jgi:hypothetical protein
MPSKTQFTPSASASFNALGQSASYALPAVDPANTSMVIANVGSGSLWYAFGTSAGPGGGSQMLAPGQDVLLTNAGSMTNIALCGFPNGTEVQVYRGTASTLWTFP